MISEEDLNLLRLAAGRTGVETGIAWPSGQGSVTVDSKILIQLLDAYASERELASATNWFDPATHFGKWRDEDTFMDPGDPTATHWLLRESMPTVKPDALCEYCGHVPEEHMYARRRKQVE